MNNIYIMSAVRSPIGTFGGTLKNFHPVELGALVAKEAIKRSNERHPTKRINNVEDVAKTAVFLLGDHNITGQIIHVDGGLSSLKI